MPMIKAFCWRFRRISRLVFLRVVRRLVLREEERFERVPPRVVLFLVLVRRLALDRALAVRVERFFPEVVLFLRVIAHMFLAAL
jgi:hypothetical protein